MTVRLLLAVGALLTLGGAAHAAVPQAPRAAVHLWATPGARSPARLSSVAVATDAADPLVPTEWWRRDIHVDTLTPPPAGVPITLVDSGVSFNHPEFAGRPNLIALNNQEPAPIGGVHGTATASVAGAPVNGVGLVGVYPTAILRSYDASLGDGTRLPSSDIAAGITAAAQAGRSVINLSLGSSEPDSQIAEAIALAVKTGSLVVASSGNSGEEGNWLSYPGASAHVFTVGATDQSDEAASFSTQSSWVDLAAPGVDIPVASALDNGYQPESGTSFSAPMVAAAAAWLWTVRPELDASQVAEILKESARDVGPPGFDTATGYGILDMTAALATPTPKPDTAEPNDSVATATTVSTAERSSATVGGRVAAFEDPRDVLRVWLPKGKRVTVRSPSAGVSFALYSGSLSPSRRLTGSIRAHGTTALSFTNSGAARNGYLVVTPARHVRDTSYSLAIAAR